MGNSHTRIPRSGPCVSCSQSEITAETIKNLEIELDTMNNSMLDFEEKKWYKKAYHTIKSNMVLTLQIASLIMIFLLSSLPYTQKKIQHFIVTNLKQLRSQTDKHFPIFAFTILSLHCITVLLPIPGTYLNMTIIGFLTRDFDKALVLNYIGFLFPVIFIYLITKYSCKPFLALEYQKTEVYETISKLVKRNPYKTTFLLWSLLLPETLKAYTIGMQPHIGFRHYIIPVLPISLVYISIFTYIGTKISHIGHPSHLSIWDYHSCSTPQMNGFYFRAMLFVATIIALCFIVKQFNKKYEEVKENAMNITVIAQSEFLSSNSVL